MIHGTAGRVPASALGRSSTSARWIATPFAARPHATAARPLLGSSAMLNLRLSACLATALAAAATTACTDNNHEADLTLHVQNDSDFSIVEIHVTQVGNPTWGPNLLTSALAPGDSLVLGINCGTYDALLVDEAGVDCELHDLDLCLNDADWIIRNNTCTVFAAARAAREAANQTTGAPVTPSTRRAPAT